ncbi:hypothetical protein [Streptococcus suis]|uniref:hypothetical protein n=1 Tax=Streptococcus suis TaxID=1307 RepID=UPI003D80ADD7
MAIESGNVKKAGIGYIIGNYFLRGIGFLTLPLFSRLLTTEDFGEYSQLKQEQDKSASRKVSQFGNTFLRCFFI